MSHRPISNRFILVCAAVLVGVQAQAEEPSVLVTLTTLRAGTLPRQITAYGRVDASEAGRLSITAQDAAQIGTVYVHLGQSVDKGVPLVQLKPTPRTEASYAQAQSALSAAHDLAARTHALLLQHLATAQQLASATQAETDARANLEALNRVGANGPRVVRAPFASIVTSLSAKSGMIVSEGAELMNLVQPRDLVLTVGLQPGEAAVVRTGDKAQVTAIGEQTRVAGVVSMCGSAMDPSTALVPVQIRLPARRLLPGQSAEAVITSGAIRGYVVPREAVLVDDNGEPYVVQAQAMKARKVAVQVISAQRDQDVISGKALVAGQPLVLSGNYQLDDGMALRLADAPGKSAP
jgi:RND family efflux transporter MFP subunit